MVLPKLTDEVEIKRWDLKIKKDLDCYLYNFNLLGITPTQFVDIFAGKKALVFERRFDERLRWAITKCPWCEYSSAKRVGRKLVPRETYEPRIKIQDHIYSHNKNIVNYQVLKFCEDLYRMRLQLVREGWHSCVCFLVKHECQFCITPKVKGRKGMCAIPTATRNRVMSLQTLGYPIDHLIEKKVHEWSVLGVIILVP